MSKYKEIRIMNNNEVEITKMMASAKRDYNSIMMNFESKSPESQKRTLEQAIKYVDDVCQEMGITYQEWVDTMQIINKSTRGFIVDELKRGDK